MKIHVTYKRLEPDTVQGDKIELNVRYSSFNTKEIDELEQTLREQYKDGIIINTGE